MKLLETFPDEALAQDCALTLRSQGILTHLSTGQYPFLTRSTVWIVLDEQYADARALLDNPCHQVQSGLPEEEIVEIEREASMVAPSFWDGVFTHPLFLLVLVGMIMLFLWLGLGVFR